MLHYWETIPILYSRVPLQEAGNVGIHEILTRYIDFFKKVWPTVDQLYYYEKLFIIHLRGTGISFEGHSGDEADSSEEAGTHGQKIHDI